MQNNLNDIKKKASYFIIAMVMWEFFSYFGMQAMLILYLTQKLHMTDPEAYKLYGSFTSLIFVTPIIGGWLADKFCGYRYAVMWGTLLIILGHLVLSSFTLQGLYWGLSLLILGIGLFKSNAICLIAECYPKDSAGKMAAFSWYYVSGNLGAMASQLLCPYIAETLGWSAGFLVAAVGMVLGLISLILSRPYFSWQHDSVNQQFWKHLSSYSKTCVSLIIIGLSLMIAYSVMKTELVGHLLIVISLLSVFMFAQVFKEADAEKRKLLARIAILTLFATGFWIFDQQGSSSISLFISRYVHREINNFIVPAGMFQSISPTMILITGIIMAYVWKILAKRNIKLSSIAKLSIAMFFLSLGFIMLVHASSLAFAKQMAPMWLPIISLVFIGSAEVFVDPVILAAISEASPAKSSGRLVAIYYLAVGGVANYLAAWVADFTTDPTTRTASALTYYHAYSEIVYIAIGMFLCLIFWMGMKFFTTITTENYHEEYH